MIGSFSGMRAKMQSLSKMMKMGGGAQLHLSATHIALTNVRLCGSQGAGLTHSRTLCACRLARNTVLIFIGEGCKVQVQLTIKACPGHWQACSWNCNTSKQVQLCKPHWP